MKQVLLNIPKSIHTDVFSHLLPSLFLLEEAAFMYVQRKDKSKSIVFDYVDWASVPPTGFLYRSSINFELTDEMRAEVIKRSHDLGASIVEFHSHKGYQPAEFSPSDLLGFHEFVPHVWWRLKGRPYLAVVVSRFSFDGLVWVTDPHNPRYIDGILADMSLYKPTKKSRLRRDYYGKHAF